MSQRRLLTFFSSKASCGSQYRPFPGKKRSLYSIFPSGKIEYCPPLIHVYGKGKYWASTTSLVWKRPIIGEFFLGLWVLSLMGCTVKAVGDPNRPITINAHVTVDIKGLKNTANSIEDYVSGQASEEDLKGKVGQ